MLHELLAGLGGILRIRDGSCEDIRLDLRHIVAPPIHLLYGETAHTQQMCLDLWTDIIFLQKRKERAGECGCNGDSYVKSEHKTGTYDSLNCIRILAESLKLSELPPV